MNRYTVRAQTIGFAGFITQADHYQDYELQSSESLEDVARHLAAHGFLDPVGGRRWIMPGAIIWIEQK